MRPDASSGSRLSSWDKVYKVKYISFSLFGAEDRFFKGALENLRVCKTLYPDWSCIFYVSQNYPTPRLDEIRVSGGLVVVVNEVAEGLAPTIWRFRAGLIPDAEWVLVRDLDSLPSHREVDAVSVWIESGTDFHVMRDHYDHIWHMPAGLVGFRTERTRDALRELTEASQGAYYGVDADLLHSFIWKNRSLTRLVHDSITPRLLRVNRFRVESLNGDFVGRVVFPNVESLQNSETPKARRWKTLAVVGTLWGRFRLTASYSAKSFSRR